MSTEGTPEEVIATAALLCMNTDGDLLPNTRFQQRQALTSNIVMLAHSNYDPRDRQPPSVGETVVECYRNN